MPCWRRAPRPEDRRCGGPSRRRAAPARHAAPPNAPRRAWLAAAPSRISAPRISRLASAGPHSRVRRCVPPAPGISPSRASGSPSLASLAAIRRSQASASSKPAAHRRAADLGQRDLRQLLDARVEPLDARHVGIHAVGAVGHVHALAHFLQIGAGAEHLLVGADMQHGAGAWRRARSSLASKPRTHCFADRVHRRVAQRQRGHGGRRFESGTVRSAFPAPPGSSARG